MSNNKLRPLSMVDSTYRVRWDVTKEEFESCQFGTKIYSQSHIIDINGQETKCLLKMYPKGDDKDDKDNVVIFLGLWDGKSAYKVKYEFGIETKSGHWPNNHVKKFYSRGSFGQTSSFAEKEDVDFWGHSLCTTKDFLEHFVENKTTVVASFVIFVEGEEYFDHMEVSDEYVDNMRSMSSLENLTDFTIISGTTRLPCHRLLLAARSKYFEALFRNEPEKTETEMEEPPEVVKTMLEFMSKGVIPDDLDKTAMDLILPADMYGLNLLTVACETSMVENLTPDNAVETLVLIDKINHVSKKEHREKILAFIKKKADKIVKGKDWKKFVQAYPDLITEIVLLFHKKEEEEKIVKLFKP